MSTSISRKPGFLKEINVLDNINHNNPSHLNNVLDNTVSHSPGYLKNYLDLDRTEIIRSLIKKGQTFNVNKPEVGRFNGNPGVLHRFGRNPRYK